MAFGVEFLVSKLESLGTLSEPSKEEGKDGVGEEAFLGLFAILIHCVSHQGEVQRVVRYEVVILVVSVRVNYYSQH